MEEVANELEETSSGRREISIPGYRLEGFIGSGGMGEVHRATQLSLDRVVAIKLLSPQLAENEAFVARFDKEAAALAALSHANIVSIVDKGATSFTYFLVMEHVSGPSLREMMRDPDREPIQALRMFLDICRGVEHAHGRGIIHRDLKPENILIDEVAGGAPKVTDFGLAGFIDGREKEHLTETNVAMGTAAYMAPEQRLNARDADHRADIFSLGVILYELLVGELPIGAYKLPSERRPVDPRVDRITARALELDPAKRYQKLSQMIGDLEEILPRTSSLSSRPITKFERATIAARRVLRRVAIGLALLVVTGSLLVLGVLYLRSRGTGEPTQTAAARMLASRAPMGFTEADGTVIEHADQRQVRVSDGNERVFAVSYGRPAELEGGSIRFDPNGDAHAGHTLLMMQSFDTDTIEISSHVRMTMIERNVFVRLRDFLFGSKARPSAGLLLVGSEDRYVTVVASMDEPIALEWALGEKRGRTLLDPSTRTNEALLSMRIDGAGNLTAQATIGGKRSPIGEPLRLGTKWRRHFAVSAALPGVGCIDGACVFDELECQVGKAAPELPPPPQVAQATEEPRPKIVKKPQRAKRRRRR